jgi:hypothetical protein
MVKFRRGCFPLHLKVGSKNLLIVEKTNQALHSCPCRYPMSPIILIKVI